MCSKVSMDESLKSISLESTYNEILDSLRLKGRDIILEGILRAIPFRDKETVSGTRSDISHLCIDANGRIVKKEFKARIDDASIGNRVQIYRSGRRQYLLDTQLLRIYKV